MAIKALDAANFLIYVTSNICDDLTNMKLNKLLYFAQGHNLKENGTPLFNETIEAWDHGPVVPEVYRHYNYAGDSPINDWDPDSLSNLSDSDKSMLMDVAKEYCRYTASTLRNMTHRRKGPWDTVYVPETRNIPIPLNIIKEYFDNNVASFTDTDPSFTDDDYIGYYDSDGYLVLPKEWDDETI